MNSGSDPEPDTAEKVIRFICGSIAGLFFVGGVWWHFQFEMFWLFASLTVLVCGVCSVYFGHSFWYNLSNWWNWIKWW